LEHLERGEHAGVVDQQVHVARALGEGAPLGFVGDVERDGDDARVARDVGGQGLGVAAGGVDAPGSAGEEGARDGEADPAVGTGDEGDGLIDVHEALSFRRHPADGRCPGVGAAGAQHSCAPRNNP
jgi:hypothetical protein